jgi:hypothetical protein
MRLSGQEYVDMYSTQAKAESKRLEKEATEAAAAAKAAADQKKAS